MSGAQSFLGLVEERSEARAAAQAGLQDGPQAPHIRGAPPPTQGPKAAEPTCQALGASSIKGGTFHLSTGSSGPGSLSTKQCRPQETPGDCQPFSPTCFRTETWPTGQGKPGFKVQFTLGAAIPKASAEPHPLCPEFCRGLSACTTGYRLLCGWPGPPPTQHRPHCLPPSPALDAPCWSQLLNPDFPPAGHPPPFSPLA